MALKAADVRNDFCSRLDLSNEASVEQFFLNRLLKTLGYSDRQIRPKASLDELHVNLGRRKLKYRPDYAVKVGRSIRWIVEAKAVNESLDDFVGQSAGYCLNLNRAYANGNPVEYFLLSNGLVTRVYQWDQEEPVLELSFEQFRSGDVTYAALLALLKREAFTRPVTQKTPRKLLTLTREPIDQVNAAFAWCHQFIYKKDNLSQAAAFSEFSKLVFLKLLSDRDVHRNANSTSEGSRVAVPVEEVKFSVDWIERRERDHPNPLDALQFRALLETLEADIQARTRKRVFDTDEHLSLAPETIKGVVRRLEPIDLFGIDADLNGRLFETFLNATMRGKDLGQFFTPRSVVKLGVRLARLQADRDEVHSVLDACCGTGGYLIDVLADMWAKVDANESLSNRERAKLKNRIANECIVGVDIARDPPLARIARMNMYLHGDGGSRIYQADALDKKLPDGPSMDAELRRETTELRERFSSSQFDVALTNPPFAKEYERGEEREASVLDEYVVGFSGEGESRRPRARLRSSVMFLERYHDLLKPGGHLVTVIDDSVLGSSSYKWVRQYLRERFIVKAVVSLPGDAFQRSKARVKTSLIVLEKKGDRAEEQPPVFMYYATAIGVDDSPRERTLPIDRLNRQRAAQEIAEVSDMYESFLKGKSTAASWTVAPDRISDRMDVKGCLLEPHRKVSVWKKDGVRVGPLADSVDVLFPRTEQIEDADAVPVEDLDRDLIVCADADETVTRLRVRYDGFAEAGDVIEASDSTASLLYRVHVGDIVISHINAVHGAVCVVPPELDGAVVTNEYTVGRARKGVDPRLLWLLLRTPELRAELLLQSTGIGRSRVRWDDAQGVVLPSPSKELASSLMRGVKQAEKKEREARELRQEAERRLTDELKLDSEEARRILAAFKPPR